MKHGICLFVPLLANYACGDHVSEGFDAARAEVDTGLDAAVGDTAAEAATPEPDAAPPDDAPPTDAVLDSGADADTPDAALDAVVEPGDATLDSEPAPDAEGDPFACTSCHGSAANAAPPQDLLGRVDPALPTIGAHQAHLGGTSAFYRRPQCGDCHLVPVTWEDPGHLGPAPADLTWSSLAGAGGATPSYADGRCTVYCHGATLSLGDHPRPLWAGDAAVVCGDCHGLPPAGHGDVSSCSGCHPFDNKVPLDAARHIDGVLDVTACTACHDTPPPTGTHLLHAGLAAPVYGGLGTAAELASPTGYAFGCGQCHPLDGAAHMNGGPAEVELSHPLAPPGSWKALSPASASYAPGATTVSDDHGLPYTLGSCADVACHAGLDTTSGPVPEPGSDFPFTGYPVTYPPYSVTRTLVYRPATWGGSLDCAGCHDYPPRSDAPGAEGGVGSSHAAFDGAFENLHSYNHGNAPVPCRACHVTTVSDVAAWTRDPTTDRTYYEDVPVTGFSAHVNGVADVALNAMETFDLFGSTYRLAGAAYDPTTRSCSDVSCHLLQTNVVWGSPYRNGWGSVECNVCHRY